MADVTVRRVDFGYFVRPAEETGTGGPRVEPCLGYVVDHPQGTILFDTGMGSHPEVDTHYRPRRVELREALAAIGAQISDVGLAANCHLHFDHCGGNPVLGQIPVFVQGAELDAARQTQDYTLPELIEGSRFERVTGKVEVLPGVFLMPTPGHTAGHQSLIVRRPDGAVIVAGQSHDTATQYAADQLAWRAHRDAHAHPLPGIPDWIDALQQLDPRMVYFARPLRLDPPDQRSSSRSITGIFRLSGRTLIGRVRRRSAVSAMRVAAQIAQFGRGTGCHAGDQVAAHKAGYAALHGTTLCNERPSPGKTLMAVTGYSMWPLVLLPVDFAVAVRVCSSPVRVPLWRSSVVSASMRLVMSGPRLVQP